MLDENFLNFPEWKFQAETAKQPRQEAEPDLGHEQLRHPPHGVVHGVGLQEEEVPVERHVEEVGHEGDLGDGQPEAPREEVVDDPAVAPAAGEGDPHQTEAPGSLAEGVETFEL